jgi:hypothetical protein
MRRNRARIFLVAGLLTLAGTTATVAATAIPATAGGSPVVLVDCAGHGQVRPAGYDVGCTANELLARLHWASWRQAAFGSGVLKVDNCTPTCAHGRYIRYPVLTVLWRARPWPQHAGRAYFSRLTWIFTGQRPRHARAAQTLTLPAH